MINLYNEDCLEAMKRMEDDSYDLAIVDPPYGIGAENHQGKKENGWNQWKKKDWDQSRPNKEYFEQLFRVSNNQVIWGGNYFVDCLICSMGWIVWNKGQRNFSLSDGELAFSSFSRALRIFDYPRAKCLKEKRIHPTQKPVALYTWILSNYAKPGDKILDTHLGSGSIAIACHNLGFHLDGYELDVEYYNAAKKRLEEHQRQLRLF